MTSHADGGDAGGSVGRGAHGDGSHGGIAGPQRRRGTDGREEAARGRSPSLGVTRHAAALGRRRPPGRGLEMLSLPRTAGNEAALIPSRCLSSRAARRGLNPRFVSFRFVFYPCSLASITEAACVAFTFSS